MMWEGGNPFHFAFTKFTYYFWQFLIGLKGHYEKLMLKNAEILKLDEKSLRWERGQKIIVQLLGTTHLMKERL